MKREYVGICYGLGSFGIAYALGWIFSQDISYGEKGFYWVIIILFLIAFWLAGWEDQRNLEKQLKNKGSVR